MNNGRLKRAIFRAIDIDNFPQVDTASWAQDQRQLYDRRKLSLELYHNGRSEKFIVATTSRNRQQVNNDVGRFLKIDRAGNYYGWSAIITGRRLCCQEQPDSSRNKKRRKNVYFARGSFTKLLNAYPQIKNGLDNIIRGKQANGKARVGLITPGEIHKEFIQLCQDSGLCENDYPLVTKDRAKRALQEYRNRCLSENPEPVLKALFGQEAVRELMNATGRESAIPLPRRLYQRAEVDGHELPIIGTIELPGTHPLRPIVKALKEITVVFVVEWGSAAILGYSIRYGKNYSSRDVLRAIRSALLPWKPMELDSRLRIQYPSGGGLPAGLIPELEYAIWRELHWDNCPSHLSPFLISQLPGFIPIASPRAAPDTHAVIESVNGIFDRFFKDELCGTANGSAQAEFNSKTLGITTSIIEQLIDVAVATYNSLPPSGTNVSKIALLRRFASDPRSAIPRIPIGLRPRFRLYDFEAVVPVHGSKRRTKSGPGLSCPYLHFHHGDYTSIELARRFDLIGTSLMIRGESDDLRYLDCWLLDGIPIGRVDVLGPWRQSKHGFEIRSISDQLRRKGKLINIANPVEAVVHTLQQQALIDSRAALQLARVLQEAPMRLTPFVDNAAKSFGLAYRHASDKIADPFPDLDTLY